MQRYVEAFERFDIDALVSLLSADVAFSMPPISLWVQGRAAVATFLREVGFQCEGSVLRRVGASGLPAFAQYRDAGKTPWGLVVLELRGGEVCGITTFLSVRELFPLFGLPLSVSSRRSSDEFSPRPQSR